MTLPAHWIRVRLHRLGDILPSGKRATGKEPAEKGWQRSTSTEAPPDAYGILPGPSGLAVLDVEPAGVALFPDPGRGLLVRTPSRAHHVYLTLAMAERALGRTLTGKLRCLVPGARVVAAELISFGGQVVGPGVRALSAKAGLEGVYTIERDEPPLGAGETLEEYAMVLQLLHPFLVKPKQPAIAPQAQPARSSGHTARARAALDRETSAVLSAPAGARHDTLLRAASALASLVAVGELDEGTVREALMACAQASQPDQLHEARQAIEDGIRFGLSHPRTTRARDDVTITLTEVQGAVEVPPPDDEIPDQLDHVCRTVLVPGTHKDSLGEVHAVSNQAFARRVLAVLPPDLFYRRDVVAGQVSGTRFVAASETTFRRLLSEPHVALARWARVKDDEGVRQVRQAVPCDAGLAALALDAASSALPEIKLLTSYPVVLPDGTVSPPGYSAAHGVYYAGPPIPPVTSAAEIRAHLLDLVVDFPFEDEASRVNFLGLLLTPMLRPLVGKTPLHLVTSPIARTGKSKLVEEVLGVTYLGEPLSSSQLPERPEERAKWLTALLLSGENLVHLDNLTAELDSGNLASLVTSARVSDRLLGQSTFLRLDNQLTIAATGNNTRLSGELSKRTVVVRLVPPGDHPEDRTGFAHPNLVQHVLAARQRTLGCLVGAVGLWREAGSGRSTAPFGGFEAWAATVGGILDAVGLSGHLGNRAAWREGTDAEEEALVAFVEAWRAWAGDEPHDAGEILRGIPRAVECVLQQPSAITLGRYVARIVDRHFGPWTIRRGFGHGHVRTYSVAGGR